MATRHARIEGFYKKEDTHGFSQLFHAMDMFKIIY